VNEVVLPEQEAGERLARRLIAPGVNQVLKDQFGVSAGERTVPEAWIGHTIREVDVQRRHGVLVIAIRHGTELTMAPGAHTRFETDDVLIFAGPDDRLAALGCYHRAPGS
jgi:trk system potassium uptake protein